MSRDVTELPPLPADERIAYGKAASQFFDLYQPKVEPIGAAMMIHGGFWRARYDLQHASHFCAALARGGMAVANIEYRRVGEPGGGWPGSYEDVLAAFDAVARKLGKSTVVLGHSAGGHLALRLAVDRNPAGVVALAPVADLGLAYELNLSGGAVQEFIGGTPHTKPKEFAAADARGHASSVRRILIHGDIDEDVPISISESFIHSRTNDSGPVSLIKLAGTGHMDLIDPESPAWSSVSKIVRDLLS